MDTCYATSWEVGQRGIFQRLLTFVSAEDRNAYIALHPANGGGITELHPSERASLMRSLILKFVTVLILKDPWTGDYIEYK